MGTGESLVHSEFVRLLVGVEFKHDSEFVTVVEVEFKHDSEYVTAPPHQMVVHPVQEKTVRLVLVTWEYNAQCQWMGTGEHGNPLVVVQLHVVVVFKDTLVLVTALPLRMVEDIVLEKPPRPGVVKQWPAQCQWMGTGEHGSPLVVVQHHVVVVFNDTLVLVTALPLRRVEDIVLGKPPRPGVVESEPAQSTVTGGPSDHMALALLNVDLVRR